MFAIISARMIAMAVLDNDCSLQSTVIILVVVALRASKSQRQPQWLPNSEVQANVEAEDTESDTEKRKKKGLQVCVFWTK